MKKIVLLIAALPALGACVNNGNAVDTQLTQFDTYEVQDNGDVVLKGGDEEITVTAAQLANARDRYDDVDEVVLSQWFEHYVLQASDNVVVGGGARRVVDPETGTTFVGYSGIVGDAVAAPTETAEYAGAWGAVVQTNHSDVHTESGNLSLTFNFDDNSVMGVGTNGSSTTEVLEIDAVAGADGEITGTATYTGYGPSYIRTGDLEAGFFGEDAAEIGGAFSGDGIGGTILADRVPPIAD